MPKTCGKCGTPESALAAFAQWPRSCMALTIYCDFNRLRGLEDAEFRHAAKVGNANISATSGLSIKLTDNEREADIVLKAEAMRGGILAYAYFPSTSCNEQLATRFNSTVNWSYELFLDTYVHELGHAQGLPHTNDRRDIMYPSIIPGRELDGTYGPYSRPELIKRYGPPTDPAPPPDDTPPPPDGDDKPMIIQLIIQALIEIAKQIDWSSIIDAIIDRIGKNDELRETLIAQLEAARRNR